MTKKRHVATVTKVEAIMPDPGTLSGWRLETDCGHTYVGAPHFAHKVGERAICSTHDDDCPCYYCNEALVTA